jgi:hypothetical protein
VSEARRWVKELIPLLSALLLVYAGWALIQELRMPQPTTASVPEIPVAPMSQIGSPIAVNFPNEMVMVVITPTAEATPEPTPTYAMSTKTPDLVCGEWVKRGSVCIMPPMPNTPTPVPPKCPTTEGEDCIWTGRKSDATPVAPTPLSDSRP